MQKITVIDTGSANLTSVVIALRHLGADPVISTDEKVIREADKLILPGVGTASAAMKLLHERNLPDLIRSLTKPVLGICLGMQMLGLESQENMGESGETAPVKCLGLTSGTVRLMKTGDLPLPHMGWDQVSPVRESPLFRDIPDNTFFYFVHSYAMNVCADTLAVTEYGEKFTAVVQKDNFYGTQFHPEKSGRMGARLLGNFLNL